MSSSKKKEPQYAQCLIAVFVSARNCDILVSEKDLIIIAQFRVHLYFNRTIKKEFTRFKEVTVGAIL